MFISELYAFRKLYIFPTCSCNDVRGDVDGHILWTFRKLTNDQQLHVQPQRLTSVCALLFGTAADEYISYQLKLTAAWLKKGTVQ